MSESFIEPDSLNTIFQNLSAVVDDDGATKFLNSEISSFNFDGLIPLETDTIQVNELVPGMQFILIGDSTNIIRTALKVEFDDPEMIDSATDDYTISYLGPSGDVQTVTYSSTDEIEVYYEDWENKVLGTTGWTITQAGNAIFSNVAVRGRIEATEGFLEDLGITGTLSVESGGSIEIGTDPGTPGNAGIVIDDTGIFAYDDDENITLSIDAATGDITIGGTPGDDLLTGEDVSDGGSTVISGNRITTGSVTGRVIRSNSLMSPNSGTGIYLDGDGNVRFGNANATLTFNNSGLSISGAGVTIGGTNPDNFITGSEVDANITQIDGGKITTGIIDSNSPVFIGTADGSAFATQGMAINLNNGTITTEQFRINTSGDAFFSGALSAATGTFSGTLSAGVSIDSPIITGGRFTSRSINGQSISIGESVPGWIYNAIAFLNNGAVVWRQALTTGGDILLSRIDGTSSNYFSVNGRIECTGANARFEGSGAGLFGTANNLIAKNIADYTINQNLGTNSAVGFGNVNINSMTAGQGSHFVHWNNTGTPGSQYRLSRTTSTSLASSINIKSYIEKINVDEDLLDYEFYPVKFKYNVDVDEFGEDAEYRVGIIAEDMDKIPTIKTLVQYNENNEPVGFDYQKLSLFLVPIMKKQKDKIKNLEDRIQRLEEAIFNG